MTFPVDDSTLDLVYMAVRPPEDSERSSLYDLLAMMGDAHQNDVIAALIEEIRRLRGPARIDGEADAR